MTGIYLSDRIAILEAENDELRERVIQLERAMTSDYDRMPIGGLTSSEAVVLAVIVSTTNGASKSRIFEALYAMRSSRDLPEPKIVDVMVCKLRKKLDALGVEIETIWGWGYRLSPASREALAELRRAVS